MRRKFSGIFRQKHQLIPARHLDLVLIKKKKEKKKENKRNETCCLADFAVLMNRRVEIKKCEKVDKYLDLARELKITVEHAGDY